MPRFFITSQSEDSAIIAGQDAHHLVNVHRHKLGDVIEVMGAGGAYTARIIALEGTSVRVKLLVPLASRESALRVSLLQGLLKGDKLEFILQKATELGVAELRPVECSRSVGKLTAEKCATRHARWQSIAAAAAKQCGRDVVPEILPPLDFTRAVASTAAHLKIMAYEAGGMPLKSALRSVNVDHSLLSVACLVGPEGGFSPAEAATAVDHGFVLISLGQRILRAETAALALITTVQYELGDLGG